MHPIFQHRTIASGRLASSRDRSLCHERKMVDKLFRAMSKLASHGNEMPSIEPGAEASFLRGGR